MKMPVTGSMRIEYHDPDSGATALVMAALHGSLEALECLIAYGGAVNAKDSKGNTPLALGAWADTPRCEDVVQVLLQNGADPSIPNAEGNTPIHYACQSGKDYVVMMLLDAGANPHLVNKNGETPLDVAALYGKLKVVSFLIDQSRQPSLCWTRFRRIGWRWPNTCLTTG